jgi:hypothetical protein
MYAILSCQLDIVNHLIQHFNGGKVLLHAQDSFRRSVLLIACQVAGHHEKGKEILRYLWFKFEGREFVDTEGDSQGWTFWNYVVKVSVN